MNIAVIDDLTKDRQQIINFIHTYCVKNKIEVKIKSFENGEGFLADYQASAYDIIFIDIYMNGIDGMAVAEKIRNLDKNCLIIFSTTSQSHAVKSFRVRAFDYLLKPFDYSSFNEVFTLCDYELANASKYIEVKEGRLKTKILLKQIIYTDYSNHYIQIHTNDRLIKTYCSFNDFSPLLSDYPQFLCCYRHCIINMDAVASMEKTDFLMNNGERIPIMRAKNKEIQQLYLDYIFQKLDRGF